MSRAILIMDMPEGCIDCDAHTERKMTEFSYITKTMCCFKLESIERYLDEPYLGTKPEWCPLRPINPNTIKTLRCVGSQDAMKDCYVTRYNCMVRGKKMGCKAKPDIIPCPYTQNEYNTDFGSDKCKKWLNEIADMLEGK